MKVTLSYRDENDRVAVRLFEIPDGLDPTRFRLKNGDETILFMVDEVILDEEGNVEIELYADDEYTLATLVGYGFTVVAEDGKPEQKLTEPHEPSPQDGKQPPSEETKTE